MTEEEKKAIEKIEILTEDEVKTKSLKELQNLFIQLQDIAVKGNGIIEEQAKEIEYLKKNQRFKKDFNGEKIFCLEYNKETLRDMVLEKQKENEELKSNSIPKDKIRELLENNYDISTENSRSISVEGAFAFVDDIEELLEEG